MDAKLIILLLTTLSFLGDFANCQSRRQFRRRRPVGLTEEFQEAAVEDAEVSEEVQEDRVRDRVTPRRLRQRGQVRGRGQGGRGQGGRGRGQGRGQGGRGRGRGFNRPPIRQRKPVYYDYYDEYYQYDDYDYEEYEEYQEPAPSPPRKKVKATGPFSGVQSVPGGQSVGQSSSDLPDLSGLGGLAGLNGAGLNTALIKKLWESFLNDKTNEPSRPRQPEKEYECPPRDDISYYEGDEEQCDKYYECNIKGEIREHLCPDGFTFELGSQKCDYPAKVNCSTRPKLQEPQPSTNCTRANGFFPWPANISCQTYWDCREGTAYKQTCPVGVIFDPALNTCATPDQSSRTECKVGDSSYLGFQCPEYTPDSVLMFGNHDRLAHPTDCLLYFSCLRTGGPRLATCPRKTVFNNATGQCGDPSAVPGCEQYWVEKLKDQDEDEYYYYE